MNVNNFAKRLAVFTVGQIKTIDDPQKYTNDINAIRQSITSKGKHAIQSKIIGNGSYLKDQMVSTSKQAFVLENENVIHLIHSALAIVELCQGLNWVLGNFTPETVLDNIGLPSKYVGESLLSLFDLPRISEGAIRVWKHDTP